jgi:hypothetical protein
MKFYKYPSRYTPKGVTPRRLAAQKRMLQKKVNSMPLLEEWVRDQSPSPEEKILKNDLEAVNKIQYLRDRQAKSWREVRKILFSLSKENRQQLINEFESKSYPKSPEYWLDFLQKHHKLESQS